MLVCTMKSITLPGSNIKTSSIGFGCAGLMRTATSKGRQALLNTAFDSGIIHYDVARMYGLGRVESEVGHFITDKRDQVVITTKFGIEASQNSSGFSHIINMARLLVKLVPALRKVASNRASSLYQKRSYDAKTAQACLEKSLLELKTDYVDLFLLHEPSLINLEDNDVLEFLEMAKDKGMIREYGIAGYLQDSLDICINKPEYVNVLQVQNDILGRQLEAFRNVYHGATITFSPLAEALSKISEYMKMNDAEKNKWGDLLNCDCSSLTDLSNLLLQFCLNQNPEGVVLCSSSKVERIKQMSRLGENNTVDKTSLESFSSYIHKQLSHSAS